IRAGRRDPKGGGRGASLPRVRVTVGERASGGGPGDDDPLVAVGADEGDGVAVVERTHDLASGVGRVCLYECRAFGVRGAALDRLVDRAVHRSGCGCCGYVCAARHASIISWWLILTASIAARMPSPRVPAWKTSAGALPPMRLCRCISLIPCEPS